MSIINIRCPNPCRLHDVIKDGLGDLDSATNSQSGTNDKPASSSIPFET
jgi:hypothetical protein